METETVSALRDLYRASEARAARLRLLMEASRDLAFSDAETLENALKLSARRAALFAGHTDGDVVAGAGANGIALMAPGAGERRIGTLVMHGSGARIESEDHDALMMLAQLMAAAMDRFQREAERSELLRLLQDRERRLELVVGRLFAAQEEERRRVSRELHDGVAQTATALYRKLEAGDACRDPGAIEQLAAIARMLVQELRSVIAGLRPPALDDLGLSAAIAALADGLREDGYEVAFEQTGPDRWPPIMETAFFRIAQEALSNIRKHAGGPCRVDISLSGDMAAGRWRLRVHDQGTGFPVEGSQAGLAAPGERVGLEVMQERMAALGGQLRVRSIPGAGVEVDAILEGLAR